MKILTSHPQWNTVVEVCQKLRAHGYQCVVAGGAVRDALRGVVPKDIDLATSAPAPEVLKLFDTGKYVGEHFGVVLLNNILEIATFRKEGGYKDGRHPEFVEPCSIEEDSQRRDFTINAMYFDPMENKILDFVNGQADLRMGVLRAVGTAEKRFQEDHLRILRAYRFHAKTGFIFEQETHQAILDCHQNLNKISKERIQQELVGALSEPFYYTAFRSMYENKSLQQICDIKLKFNSFALQFSLNNQEEAAFRLSAMLEGSEPISKALKYLKFSNQFIRSVNLYQRSLACLLNPVAEDEEKLMCLSEDSVWSYIEAYQAWYKDPAISELMQKFLSVSDENRKLPQPIVDGRFLIDLKLKPGPNFESYIAEAYKLQLKGVIRNQEDARLWVQSNLI